MKFGGTGAQSEQVQQEVAPLAAPEVARLPVGEPLAERIAQLQAGGNRALARLLAPERMVQREIGWPTSALTQNQTAATYSGVRRIPVRGLLAPRPGDPTWHPQPVDRALVLIPPNFNPAQPCDVLVHMHGANVGYESGPVPRDLDDERDRVEAQVAAAGRRQLVAVLPQGTSSRSYLNALGQINPREFADAALRQCVDGHEIASRPAIRSVVLSGHSGGGFAIKDILDRAAQRNDLAGVAYFDAIQATSAGPNGTRVSTGQVDAAKRLIVERITAELNALPAGATDAEKQTALSSGFSFRVYYDSAGFYQGTAGDIETFLRALFGEGGTPPRANRSLATQIAALPPGARAALRARYQTISVAHVRSSTPAQRAEHQAHLAAGTLETTGHENMVGSNAVLDMLQHTGFGQPPASTTPTTPATPATPPAPTTPAPAPPRSTMNGVELLDSDNAQDLQLLAKRNTGAVALLRQPAPPPEDVPQRLIDMTIALGRVDGAGPGGRTLLRQDYIRQILNGRSTNATFNATFEAGLAQLRALPQGPQRDANYAAQASGLILLIEDIFIRDNNSSTIDLLSPTRAAHFRAIHWGQNDYPGNGGSQTGEASAMASEIGVLRPERRPNAGANAVIDRSEMTAARRTRLFANTRPVKGQTGARLFNEAATAFELMAQMADYDGVELKILSSWRDPAVAAANAAASGNPLAVASFSSHSLGLAIDIAMSGGGAHFAEMTTHPMSNVAGMRAAMAHKWMFLRGGEFGWYPYGNEPWHWEYNPSGFRDRFRALVMNPPAAAPATGAAAPAPAAAQ